jgi:glycosyltransferase involved in cell wall biosynthesis
MMEILTGLARQGFPMPTGIDRRVNKELHLQCSKLGVDWFATDLGGFWWRDKVARLLKTAGYTSIWYPTQFTAWMPALPAVSTLHDLAGFLSPPDSGFLPRAYMNLSLRAMIARSSRLIAVSNATAADLARLVPKAAAKTIVARHGMPSDVRNKAPDLVKLKTDRDGMPVRYLFLDGANRRKRLDLCLGAFHKLGWKGRELRVTGNPSAVEGRIGRPEAENLHLLGRLSRDQLLEEIRDSDIVLYVSDFEGFGFPILEALPLKTTVVIFSGGAELEVGGNHVVVAPERTSDSLANAMREAEERCRDQAWMEAIRRHAHTFTWEESIRIHQQVFSEISQ